MNNLTVYKASAGSGKTFRLAVAYIKLLINDPMSYRNILAVTFTNKATEEMKKRILSQLYGIWKQLPDSKDYMQKVVEELEVTQEFASERAAIALSNLLHNYSYFRVETIDAFFQSVLRNLARELELTANLHIGLNDVQVEEQAVDNLIDSLQKNSVELIWIMDYIRESIDEDQSWNIIGKIKSFGINIIKDIYKAHGKELNKVLHEKDFFSHYASTLKQIMKEAKESMVPFIESYDNILNRYQLTADDFLYGKGGPSGYFEKLKEGRFADETIKGKRIEDAIADPMKWLKAPDRKGGTQAYDAVTSGLFNLLVDAENVRSKQASLYRSASITYEHLNQLRLLDSIASKFDEINSSVNRFMLSETQSLLNELIKDSDSPFIFEKIGAQLQHVMIDEFQDTSTIQWKNFKVLLKECLSHEQSRCLIVGDVKQSIYRWRSGDWRLLNNIEQEFPELNLKPQPLNSNRRSYKNIIDFNNAFFEHAKEIEYTSLANDDSQDASQLTKAYADVFQQSVEETPSGGYVRIELLPNQDYQQETLNRLTATLDDLMEKGVPPHKIAFLLRGNKAIQLIADHLTKVRPNLKLVSEDAFRLDSSPAVNILIQALHYMTHRDDMLSKATLVKYYQRWILGNNVSDNELFTDLQQLDQLLPIEFSSSVDDLLSLPVYDLAETLFSLFHLERLKEQSAYVCAFYDQFSNFLKDNIADIEAFLEAWEESIHEKTIQNEEGTGIRLFTIHKSKGLEFDYVLMPFCDWQLEKRSILWCVPPADAEPFNQLPLIPVDYTSKMKDSVYRDSYLYEHLQNTVDNLNLLYVAFTRARKALIVTGCKSRGRSVLIEKCLPEVAKELKDSVMTGGEQKTDTIFFEYGNLEPYKAGIARKSDNVFLQPSESIHLELHSYSKKVDFRQSNKSRDFIVGTDEEERQKTYIQRGSVLHYIFSTIRTTEDVPAALAKMELEGVLYDDTMTRQKLTKLISDRLSSPKVADWFSDRWQLFNECTILFVNPDDGSVVERRPDRVMYDGRQMVVVDFKFGSPKDGHKDQVRNYMKRLDEMGYPDIKGYLWYVFSNQIEEV